MTDRSVIGTREAARRLGVSEASVRRWADAGLLPARRVGRRRERRFTDADLRAFQAGGPAIDVDTVSVAGVAVRSGAHLATFFDTEAGRLRVAVPFLAGGLLAGDHCFLVCSEDPADRYLAALGRIAGVDVAAAREAGLLQVVPPLGPSPEAAIAFWEERLWDYAVGGRRLIRVVGDMACFQSATLAGGELVAFETALNRVAARSPAVFVCQYDVRAFDGEAVLAALRSHPDLYELPLPNFIG